MKINTGCKDSGYLVNEKNITDYQRSKNVKNGVTAKTIRMQQEAAALHISKEGLERSMEVECNANETVMGQLEEEQKALLDTYQEQLEDSNKAAEAQKDLSRMVEIARRIANGDKVPAKDEKKLMEFNFKLYQAAKEAAAMSKNDDPIHYESLFEDEDDVTEEKLGGPEEESVSDGNRETGETSADSGTLNCK